MESTMIGLALIALTATAAWADFNIDGFTAGMTKTETLAKLRAEGLVPKPPIIPELKNDQQFETGPYTFSFCKNDRLAGLSKTITVKEFNAKLIETLGLRGEPRVDIPDATTDILYLTWGISNQTTGWPSTSSARTNSMAAREPTFGQQSTTRFAANDARSDRRVAEDGAGVEADETIAEI
jgi:hypothetical protein